MEKFKPKNTLKTVEDVKGNWEDIGKFIGDKGNIVCQLVCLYTVWRTPTMVREESRTLTSGTIPSKRYTKWVNFMVCEFYFNKSIKNNHKLINSLNELQMKLQSYFLK